MSSPKNEESSARDGETPETRRTNSKRRSKPWEIIEKHIFLRFDAMKSNEGSNI